MIGRGPPKPRPKPQPRPKGESMEICEIDKCDRIVTNKVRAIGFEISVCKYHHTEVLIGALDADKRILEVRQEFVKKILKID